jgi:hypothetical protein
MMALSVTGQHTHLIEHAVTKLGLTLSPSGDRALNVVGKLILPM